MSRKRTRTSNRHRNKNRRRAMRKRATHFPVALVLQQLMRDPQAFYSHPLRWLRQLRRHAKAAPVVARATEPFTDHHEGA